MSDMKAYLASRYVHSSWFHLQNPILTCRYMSGPKADAILARSTDPNIKKRKKKPKNEDYTVKLENGEGLRLKDEDEWNKTEDVDMDEEDAPGMPIILLYQKEKS